jgi:hypothetical protein
MFYLTLYLLTPQMDTANAVAVVTSPGAHSGQVEQSLHSITLSHSFIHAISLIHSLSLRPSLTGPFTHSLLFVHSPTLTHSFTHTPSLTNSLSFIHSPTLIHSLSHSLILYYFMLLCCDAMKYCCIVMLRITFLLGCINIVMPLSVCYWQLTYITISTSLLTLNPTHSILTRRPVHHAHLLR